MRLLVEVCGVLGLPHNCGDWYSSRVRSEKTRQCSGRENRCGCWNKRSFTVDPVIFGTQTWSGFVVDLSRTRKEASGFKWQELRNLYGLTPRDSFGGWESWHPCRNWGQRGQGPLGSGAGTGVLSCSSFLHLSVFLSINIRLFLPSLFPSASTLVFFD